MSDEQMIYIGPEDDLTSVRERLEHTPSRRVTLVIPAQTQLHSHVAWKLLHARARELGKDVLIVSSDPRIRSVAQAVKFRVAHSQESAPLSRPRPSNRPTRQGAGGRGRISSSAQTRTPPGQEQGELRRPGSSRMRRYEPVEPSLPATPRRTQPTVPPEQRNTQDEDAITGTIDNNFRSPLKEYPDVPPARPFDQSYSPPREITPPIRPLSEIPIEEPNWLEEDYQRARDIEIASRGGVEDAASVPPSTPESESTIEEPWPSSGKTAIPHIPGDDPFAYMDDSQPPPARAEQLAHGTLEGFDSSEHAIQDISERPTDVIEDGDVQVEDLGDQGGMDMFADTPPISRQWEELPEHEEPDSAAPVRNYGATRSRPITGSMSPSRRQPQTPSQQNIASDDDLPPVDERPTQQTPAAPPSFAPAARSFTTPPTGQRRPPLSRPSSRELRQGPQPSRAGARGGQTSRYSRQSTRRSNTGGYVFAVIIILAFLIVGVLAYLIPSAVVTVTLPARAYTHAVKLTALPRGQRGASLGTVPAQVLTKDFSQNGTGTATGQAKIGTAPATGSVTFTNNGSSYVKIPSGVAVATAGPNSVQFVTTAEAVVPPPGSVTGNTIVIPVQAQQSGVVGNVAAGSITVIPDASLNQIAQTNNVATSSLKLQVNNDSATTGGGVGNATVVTRNDLNKTQQTLQAALNNDINAWISQQKPSGQDIVGKPSIVSSLVNPPSVGQVENSGTFPAQLKATVTVMIIRGADLQASTIAQLRNFLKNDKTYTGFTVVSDPKQPVKIQSLTTSGQGTTETLSFTATGSAIPDISQDQVRALIKGKTVPNALTTLKGLRDVENVDIKTSPGFVFWIPTLSSHITVNLIPGPSPASAK